MVRGDALRCESTKRLESMALIVGFFSFVGIWRFVPEFVGNGNGLMGLVKLVGGAVAGLTIYSQISDDVDKTYEVPSATCRVCHLRESVPGYKICQPCSDEGR